MRRPWSSLILNIGTVFFLIFITQIFSLLISKPSRWRILIPVLALWLWFWHWLALCLGLASFLLNGLSNEIGLLDSPSKDAARDGWTSNLDSLTVFLGMSLYNWLIVVFSFFIYSSITQYDCSFSFLPPSLFLPQTSPFSHSPSAAPTFLQKIADLSGILT